MLATGTGDVAIPNPLVTAVTVALPPNVVEGPLAGAVKVTATPETGFNALSVTLACSGFAKEVPTVAVCPEPEYAVIDAGTARDAHD